MKASPVDIRAPARTTAVPSVPRWSSAPLADGKVVWNTGDEAAERGAPGVRIVHAYPFHTKKLCLDPRRGVGGVELNSLGCIAHDGPQALSGTFNTVRPSGA